MKTKILLVLIVALAFFLRFYALGSYPALNADEASNGYDAYSLIQTGMDQHGHKWPLTFQSFNDYKPGLYVYLTIPFVKIFGLNEWSVRVPGAFLGTLSIFVVYLLVKELFKKESFALIAALFLAISPWHIQFSRGGWEVNASTFFIMAGLLFFFRALHSIKDKNKFTNLIFSSLFLVASLYTYHASRVLVPLIGLAILIIYKREIFKDLKKYLIFIGLSAVLLIPLVLDLMAPGALSRAAGVGLFADKGPLNRINEQRGEHGSVNSKVGKLIHNKVVNYGLEFLSNYASHFNGEFLFMSGDSIERNKVPETGEMYLFDIIFIAVGIIAIAKVNDKNWKFIISWLIVAPMASSLTFQSPNALRSQNMVIPLIIISAFGFNELSIWLKNKKLTPVIYLFALLIIWNFARYQEMYWRFMSKEYPYSSQYGLKELVAYVNANQSKYKDVYVTTRYDQPYALFLFYLKYPPTKFQFHHTLTSRDEFGFSTVADFDKYHFGSIDFSSMQNDYPNSLIIGTPQEIPQTANIVKRIYGSNGFEYFDIVQN